MSSARRQIRSLQLGLRWFPEFSGGLHRLYYEMVRHLPPAGVEVRGLVTGSDQVAEDSGGMVRAFAEADAPLATRCLALRRELRRMLSEQPPDLVAAHFALYAFPVLDMLRQRPFVFHFHGPWAQEALVEGDKALKIRAKAALERAVYHRAARCIVLSSSFRDVLHQDYGVPLDRIRLVPGGVELDRWRTPLTPQEAREHLGWAQDRPVIFTARRLARRMGLENLVSAISEVRRRIPEVLLLIAGKGSISGELEAQIRSSDLGNNVKLLGFVPDEDLPIAYRAANLSVMPTIALEGFGMVAVESLAAGTPVLVTPVGGLPGVVSDLSTDLVLPGSGIPDLVEGLQAALQGELTLPDTAACQDYVRSRYDWPVVAARMRDVYEEALG